MKISQIANMKQDNISGKKETKKIRLKDLISVDYTDGSWPEDEDGQLAYNYSKRSDGTLDEKASWIDGYIDKYTQRTYDHKNEILTLTWRNYEKWPKKFKVDKDSWAMLTKSQNIPRTFNQLKMAGKIKLLDESRRDDEISKYELNGELQRIKKRISFLRSAHHGTALPKDVSDELRRLEDAMKSVLGMLKEENIIEDSNEYDLNEALNLLQRMKRRAIMRRNKSKILAGRRRAQRRKASTSVLKQRAIRAARNMIARRLLRKDKGEASYAERTRVEKMLASKQSLIQNIARKMLPKIRQKELNRFNNPAK